MEVAGFVVEYVVNHGKYCIRGGMIVSKAELSGVNEVILLHVVHDAKLKNAL